MTEVDPSSAAGSNADLEVSAAVSALVEAASRQFSPELTSKILELLCDETVSLLDALLLD